MATEKVTIKMIGKIKEIPTKNGSFKYLNVMCTTGGQYPKDVCFKQSGKTISLFDSFAVGEEVDISFNIDSKVPLSRFRPKLLALTSSLRVAMSGQLNVIILSHCLIEQNLNCLHHKLAKSLPFQHP